MNKKQFFTKGNTGNNKQQSSYSHNQVIEKEITYIPFQIKSIADKKPSFIITIFRNEGKDSCYKFLLDNMTKMKVPGVAICTDIICSKSNWTQMKYMTKCSHILIWIIEEYELSTQILMSKTEEKLHPFTYIVGDKGIDTFFPSTGSKFTFMPINKHQILLEKLRELNSVKPKPMLECNAKTYAEYLNAKIEKKDKDTDSDLLNYYIPIYHATIEKKDGEKEIITQLTVRVYVPGYTAKDRPEYQLFKSGDLIYFIITGNKVKDEEYLDSTRFFGKFKLRLSFLKESLPYSNKLPEKPIKEPLIGNGMIEIAYEFSN